MAADRVEDPRTSDPVADDGASASRAVRIESSASASAAEAGAVPTVDRASLPSDPASQGDGSDAPTDRSSGAPRPGAAAVTAGTVRRKPWGSAIAITVAVVAALLVLVTWQRLGGRIDDLESQASEAFSRDDELRDAVQRSNRDVALSLDRQRSIDQKLDSGQDRDRVLREEMLVLGERTAAVEDRMASLARDRLDARTRLILDETEFVLVMAAERAELFGDLAGASRALELADGVLAAADDPLATQLRAVLAAERSALASVGSDPRAELSSRLDRVANTIAAAPMTVGEPLVLADANDSGLRRALARLVTVRRSAGDPIAERERAAGARAAMAISIARAQLALAASDAPGWRSALSAAAARIDALALGKAEVAVAAELAALQAAEPRPPDSESGATLTELRRLRALRNLDRTEPTPAPADWLPDPGPAAEATLDGEAMRQSPAPSNDDPAIEPDIGAPISMPQRDEAGEPAASIPTR